MRRLLTLYIYMVAALALHAQVPIPELSGIRLDSNRLDFPASQERFDAFRNRLQDSTVRLNILHIGGSHVQAGIFSHRLRQHFGAARGLLFPWKATRTNAPTDYSLTHTGLWTRCRCLEREPSVTLGLSGAAVITSDSAASLRLDLPAEYAFSRLRLLGEVEGAALPYLMTDDGDTITATRCDGDYLFDLTDTRSACTLAFGGMTDGARFTLRGLFPENAHRITYTESGVNGASVPSWLRCTLLEDELRRTCVPDLVIFGIGINDANVPLMSFDPEAFKANYRQLMATLQRVNPEVCFLFITNNDCFLNVRRQRRTYNRNTQKVEQAMMDLARESNGAVWNQFRIMGGYGSSNRWVMAHLMNRDHIHFLRPGYELLADLLYNAIANGNVNVNLNANSNVNDDVSDDENKLP